MPGNVHQTMSLRIHIMLQHSREFSLHEDALYYLTSVTTQTSFLLHTPFCLSLCLSLPQLGYSKNVETTRLFFFFQDLFYLKDKVRDLPSKDTFPNSQQQPGLGKIKSRSQKFPPGFLCWWLGPKKLGHFLLLSYVH